MYKSRVEPTILFIEKISFSLKLFSGHFYGQSFIKTVRGPSNVERQNYVLLMNERFSPLSFFYNFFIVSVKKKYFKLKKALKWAFLLWGQSELPRPIPRNSVKMESVIK